MSNLTTKLSYKVLHLVLHNEREDKGGPKKNVWRSTKSPEEIWALITPHNAGAAWQRKKARVLNRVKTMIKKMEK